MSPSTNSRVPAAPKDPEPAESRGSTPEQDRARDLRETDERVTRAIDEAKLAAAKLVRVDRGDDDEPGHDRLPFRRHRHDPEAVRQNRHDQRADHRPQDRAAPARERRVRR